MFNYANFLKTLTSLKT